MSKSRDLPALAARLAALALIVGGSTAAAVAGDAGAGDGERRVIRIHQGGDCAGEDCAGDAAIRTQVFVAEEGEVHEMPGGGFQWVTAGTGGTGGAKAGFLGVMLAPMTPELRTHEGVPESVGVLVSRVIEDSPAARAGLRVGDVVTAVDGAAVAIPHELANAIRGHQEGDVVTLELWRDGAVQNLTATVEERESAGSGPRRRMEIRCEGGDCDGIGGEFEPYDCGTPECEVQVRCTGDGCDCTVNGDAVDCVTIPGPHNDR